MICPGYLLGWNDGLVMVSVLTLTDILLRLFVKGLLASNRAEVIGLPFVFRCASRSRGVNLHATDRVFYGIRHMIVSFHLLSLPR